MLAGITLICVLTASKETHREQQQLTKTRFSGVKRKAAFKNKNNGTKTPNKTEKKPQANTQEKIQTKTKSTPNRQGGVSGQNEVNSDLSHDSHD